MHATQCTKIKERNIMSEFWSNLTDESEALDAILTGYKGEVKNMPIYEDVTKYLVGNHDKSVLDFGCGAGRNIQWLKHNYKTVYGYDFPNMLKLAARETLEDENVYLSSNLDDICSRDYDVVLFSLVLQHIHPNELRDILKELCSCSRQFIIHSRTWVDFTFEPILPILNEFFDHDVLEYKKDPNSELNDHFVGVFFPKE